MEENNKKSTQQKQEVSQADLERLELLQRAHEKKGKQLTIECCGRHQTEGIYKEGIYSGR